MAELPQGLRFDCPCCGQIHTGLPAVAYPEPTAAVDAHGNVVPYTRIGDDFCILEDEHFFVRAVLRVPIIGTDKTFEWGVWGSLSQTNYKSYWDSFDDTDQGRLGSMFSYLSNELDGYSASLHLHSSLWPQNERMRPTMVLDPDQDHPLVHDQLHGITIERAVELVLPVLHPAGDA